MAGVRLACKIAANDLHQPAGPASDRRRDPGNRGPIARRRRGGAVCRGHLERWHSRAAVPLVAGRAVHHALGNGTHHTHVTVQPLSLAYVGFGGVPIGRSLRERVAWYGDADLVPHLLRVLSSGAVDVT